MANIKPIGSEKLEGMDKIKRIMEIARYKENLPQNINETSSSEYQIGLVDGNTYEIVKERQGYIIKRTITESQSEYIDNIKGRKYYPSYSQALKRLNLMTKEINTLYENEEGTSILGDEKKKPEQTKYVLKLPKEEPVTTTTTTAAPAPVTPPAAAPAPAPVGGEVAEQGVPAAPPAPAPVPAEPPVPAPAEGGLPTGEEPAPEEEVTDVDIDVEEKPKERKISDLKRIQILVGKLAQKIRNYEEDKELSAKDVKYIINSILSAIDVEVLDENDIEQIINKLEGLEDEGEGDDETEDISIDDEEEIAPAPPTEPEMAEGFDNLGDAFQDLMGGAMASGMAKKLTHEEEGFDSDDEYHRERRKGRKNYPSVDRFEHGTFAESSVDKVLSRYFLVNEDDQKNYITKRDQKTEEVYRKNKQNVIRLSETTEQLETALNYIKEFPRTTLVGLSNQGNLLFKEGITNVKVTKEGDVR
jgi:hypothetical protein